MITGEQWFFIILLGVAVGTLAWLIAYALMVRRFSDEITMPEDRSTDALKPVEMADPNDPDTWMYALTPLVELSRDAPNAELTNTLRHRGAFLAGNSGRNQRCK